jgi:4-hydroxy-3-methylbut-2-enyl diphosphate reductase
MKVTVAKSAGFCFGVERAVQMVYDEAAKDAGTVYTMGPIIHNELVVKDLAEKGVRIVNDDLICPETGKAADRNSTVIIRSHGISESLYQKVKNTGCTIVDATCPFVQKIHNIVREESARGVQIVIVGSPDHPEVQGIRGCVSGPCTIVSSKEEAGYLHLDPDRPVCIVSQTTFNFGKFLEIVEIIEGLGYHVVVKNTICNATRERQAEALDLAKKSDVMIVIGGKASSNTQKLYEICKSQCKNTYYIQTQEDLVTVDIQPYSCVGITAGASTPNQIIQEVSQHVRRTKL